MSREVQDEGFLGRWARRKAQQHPDPDAQEEKEQALAPAEEEAGDVAPEAEITAEDLPDPETLGREDDWTPFLKRGVPPEIRTRALRRLWRLDPVFANLDGLVDYAEDFNGPQFTGQPVKTLFKVGRGMLADEEPQKPPLHAEPEPEPEHDTGAAAEESAEPPLLEAGESAETPELLSDPEFSRAEDLDSGAEPEIRAEAPVRDNPPRRRGALARRWGFEPGADRQDR